MRFAPRVPVLRIRETLAACAVLVLAASTAACSSAGQPAAGGSGITVFAASSLTDVVEAFNDVYDGGGKLRVNVGSSSQLVAQMQSGAESDVVLTADLEALEPLRGSGRLAAETVLASNALVLALAPGNPAGIEVLPNVAADAVHSARCAPSVPCGRAADRVLDRAGVVLPAPSMEDSVRSVLTKVSTGQADAGFVYRTDALAAAGSDVTFLALDDPAPNHYPAALTTEGAGKDGAKAFYDWLQGPEAAAILANAGFGPAGGGSTGPGAGGTDAG